jgi:Domain of unknown function (DUF4337)
MTHTPDQHVEHADHAAHAAQNPFDRQVTMTIAIVAAVLACATMLAHRAHTLTLSLQIEANDAATQTFNVWTQYQAKRNRQDLQATKLSLVKVLGTATPSEEAKKEQDSWKEEIERYHHETTELAEKAKEHQQEMEKLRKESHHIHHAADLYDTAELSVELALVLCAVAVLTKRRGFWYAGLVLGAVGLAILGFGALLQYGLAP